MKKNLLLTAITVLGIGVLMLAAACSSSSPSTTTATPPTSTTTPPVTTTTSSTTPTVTTTTTTPSPAPTTTTTTPPVTTTTTSTPPATTTTTTTTAAAATWQTLANSGQTIYNTTCATCHGKNGEGTDICPVTIWGTGATLGSFNGVVLFGDAAGMYNYMSKSMPLTKPGSMTQQQYQELLAYILVQANKVSPTTTFDQSNLSSISIP